MTEDHMDKLMRDIQHYLKEENRKEQKNLWAFIPTKAKSVERRPLPRPIFVGLITLFSACAVGSITVAILLLGFVGAPAHDSARTIWLLAGGGCGIFFSTMLVAVWKRLMLLRQIEENTRLILASKLEANALLEQFIQNMT